MSPLELALWPAPQDARAATAPRDVARSFVEDFVGFENPALGPYTPGNAEVLVFRRGADGRRTDTVAARSYLDRLEGRRWFVQTVLSAEIEISAPGSHDLVSSPVKIAGSRAGRGGDVVVRVHAAFDPRPLGRRSVAAGATGTARFAAALTFATPRRGRGVIVARAGGGRSGSQAFAAMPVRFGTPVGSPPMWPPQALEFLRELEASNDRAWFRANRARYDAQLVEPARELAATLAHLGPPRLFRPYNDARFQQRPPIKEQLGMAIGPGPAGGFYVELSLDGLLVGAGLHHPAPTSSSASARRSTTTAGRRHSSAPCAAPRRPAST